MERLKQMAGIDLVQARVLDLYTSVMNRQAFDLDFMSPGSLAATAEEQKAEVQTAVTQEATADRLADSTAPEGKAS